MDEKESVIVGSPFAIRVFLSYTHDSPAHKARVLELANRLRDDGIVSEIDGYYEAPAEGWPRWMLNQIEQATFVLIVCTETYHLRFRGKDAHGRGRGAKWEGAVITQELYDAELRNTKFIPLLFSGADEKHIPVILRGTTYYNVGNEAGYVRLYRRLTGQPETEAPPLGKIRDMPPANLMAEARLEEARGKLKAAGIEFNKNKFDTAAQLSLEAADLAKSAKDAVTERRALLQALRALGEQVASAHVESDVERLRLTSLIHEQIDRLEKLGEMPGTVALERAFVARLEHEPEAAIEFAQQAASLSEGDVFVRADALITRLQGLWQLGRLDDALALREEVEDVRKAADDDPRLVLGATWLRTVCKVGEVAAGEVAQFVEDVRALAATGKLSRERLGLVLNQVEHEFARAGSNEYRLTFCDLAYEILEPLGDSRRLVLISLEAAELAASLGESDVARKHLGRSDAWASRQQDQESDRASAITFSAMRLFARGRTLTRLADGIEPPSQESYRAAYAALGEAMKFATEHAAEIRGNVALYHADLAWWLGRTAINTGRVEEGVRALKSVRTDAAMANPHFVSEVAVRAWGLEAEALALMGKPHEAGEVVEALLKDLRIAEAEKGRARALQKFLDRAVRPTVDWFSSPEALRIRQMCMEDGLRRTVARQSSNLVSWWKEWRKDDGGGPNSELLDFWGRGGFSRIAVAIRAKPHGAIAVDAHSIADIRNWARVFCPLFDTVIIKWKGELASGLVITPVHDAYGDGQDDFGGHGYSVCSDELSHPEWHPAVSWANPLPHDVSSFLAGEALPLITAGRLIVLPAPLVGCTQTAVGWTDNLLVETLLGGVVNVARKDETGSPGRQRVLDITKVQLPYIDGVELGDLANVLDETEDWVGSFRSLLLKVMSRDDLSHERWELVASFEYDIVQACRELREHLESLAKRHESWRVREGAGAISAGERGDMPLAHEPVTSLLQAVASTRRDLAPWIPYLRLQDGGGVLNWTCPLDNPSVPPDPISAARSGPELQSWLYPGTGGWGIPAGFMVPAS